MRSTTKPTAPRRQRTEDRRPQIADAALRILATKGAGHLTAAALGREVGIADSTIFRHYRDMDEVVLAAIDRVRMLLDSTYPPNGGSPLGRLRALFLARLALICDHPEVLRLASSDRLEQVAGPEGARRLRATIQQSRDFIETCLREAQAQGEVAASLDVTVLGWIVRGTLQVAVAAATGQRSPAPRAPEAVWSVLEQLLRGAPAPDRAP
ncbi:MAG: TetR/AcrR family transcriptional regulator [Myxococcales bacterium]|nr:TetR/AcrR family transcriptional regulator [Myxococcales bacterium]MBK7192460.1 TetR/AcrR family transcriptional regulator [Myxococcales bacterium]